MKINKFLLGAFALSVGFASCSNEEPIKGDNGGATADGEKYVAVRIQSVGDNGSRAAGEGFEEGVGTESKITAENIRFYFFTDQKRPFLMSKKGINGSLASDETNMVKPNAITENITTDGTHSTLNGVLILGTPTEAYKGNKPAYVICVANPTSSIAFEKFENQNMENLLDIKATAPTSFESENEDEELTFVMTSSTYMDATGNIIYYTDLDGKIFDKADDAQKTPADIYLERLASKVRATGLQEWPIKEADENNQLVDALFDIHTLDADNKVVINEDVKLTVDLTGWRLRNKASNNYAIKNLRKSWFDAAPFKGQDNVNVDLVAWNPDNYHRSYWTDPSSVLDSEITNVPFDIYDAGQFKNKNFSSTNPQENIVYCYENTIQPASASDRANRSTAIAVRGVVKMDGQPVNLCKWGGDYYAEEALQQMIINNYNGSVNDKDKLEASAVEFKKYTVEGARSNTWYAYVMVNGEEVNTGYRYSNISRWIDGQTSYVVNVKHMFDKYGVVRNHIYDYEFTNVVGLGVPGNDPKNPDPETETYLAARVHVLNWHVVSNKVVLE
ncbi:Mfa1 family fimbria major subunit [uncultured Duncaniella sp.]|uniref:Mfa1 family fimbria major subunit n=1 Tax=uncultured Duncaniella sp. TaxID=2768039 RepID=UPI002731D7E0|nr:Mfa1 family fimbria major subunit [uncultured Duncaniella sp.]